MNDPVESLPPHIEQTIDSVARLHHDHHLTASWGERSVVRVTAMLGRPGSLLVFLGLVLIWTIGNYSAQALGKPSIDPPPYPGLTALLSLAQVIMVMLVLITQRREGILGEQREQLALELAMSTEKRVTKLIQLIEELRRDSPHLPDRFDREAEDLGRTASLPAVVDALKNAHAPPLERNVANPRADRS